MTRISESAIKGLFAEHDLEVVSVDIGEKRTKRELRVVFSHLSYPNVEAHIFTAADAAGWTPRLDSVGDIEIRHPIVKSENETESGLTKLSGSFRLLMGRLRAFRQNIGKGEIPDTIWAHYEPRWHRALWSPPHHTPRHVEEFIRYVDPSIRRHISQLNDLGFATIESCSGLLEEHQDREPYWPYVMFDERVYPGAAPHLFTLGNVAGWDVGYAPHNFDIYLRVKRGKVILQSFDRLVGSAAFLCSLIRNYREMLNSTGITFQEWWQRAFSYGQEGYS
ncbi:hypothetical protein EU537_09510 [Candidatus Thorarchaeota archaeon]|nr:MAG: hypothetical protein EU537_09510 [Candidatus Thorarchaeota archaeon]